MNIKEIAQLAGVSASTVSKIVNQKDESISSETRERVLKIVREYNYPCKDMDPRHPAPVFCFSGLYAGRDHTDRPAKWVQRPCI